jgi:hypothetical protein
MRMFTFLITPILALLFTSCEKENPIVYPKSFTYQSVKNATGVSYFTTSGIAINTANSGTSMNNFLADANELSTVISEIMVISRIELLDGSNANLSNTIVDNPAYGLTVAATYSQSGSNFEFQTPGSTTKSKTIFDGTNMTERVLCFSYTKKNAGKTTASAPTLVFYYDTNNSAVIEEIKTSYNLSATDTVAITYFDLVYKND